MPSQYTRTLYDGEHDFASFVRSCAGAFNIRFDYDGKPVLRTLDPETQNRVAIWQDQVDRLAAVTLEEAEELCVTLDAERQAIHDAMNLARVERAVRVQAMIDKVAAWDADVHLRQFMLDQLHECLRFECAPVDPLIAESAETWLTAARDNAQRMLESAKENFDLSMRAAATHNDRAIAIYLSLLP